MPTPPAGSPTSSHKSAPAGCWRMRATYSWTPRLRDNRETNMRSRILPSAVLLCAMAAGLRAEQIEIKMATLAPENSPWCDVLVRMGEKWRTISNGNVKLTLYPGGKMGDEP